MGALAVRSGSRRNQSCSEQACVTMDTVDERQLVPLMNSGAAQGTLPVLVPGLFSHEDIEFVKALGHEMRHHIREANNISWTTRYLHTNGIFRQRAPALFARMREAAVAADSGPGGWGLLEGGEKAARLQPRVIEHHLVTVGGSLADPFHYDEGSVLTVDVMLADPEADFEGGKFSTMEGPGEFRVQPFGKGDAIVFVSHKYHSVRPVSSGLRQVLVMELWEGRECLCAHRCEVRWGTCPRELELDAGKA